MGRDVQVKAHVADDAGKPVADALVLLYVNERRWGAHERTDAAGEAVFQFPLPNPGLARVKALAVMGATPGPEMLLAGRLMPAALEGGGVSSPIDINVTWRRIDAKTNGASLVGMQWEPWFTPRNAFWQTAQAVPSVGFYDSYNRDVIRQHVLWFADLGVDFIMPDWSNHIWGKQHWSERPPATNEIIHATNLLLETLADMKQEGIPAPKVVLMPGLSNGPPAAMTAVNEELAWVHDAWVKNPRFDGLWLDFDGKPLIVILDCGTVARKEATPVDESLWTVRWMSTQLQKSHHEELGYWTWMDGSARPVVTYRDGKPEVVTPTPAYFGDGGWLYPQARGRRGGTTYIESFKTAMESRPRVILLHQWNEYAGQPEGQGYGDKHDVYVDSYSVELSDDLEPVSMTADGYRKDTGGWGYYYINLTQALMAIYRDPNPQDTLLAAYASKPDADTLRVEWNYLGKTPHSFTIVIDGRSVAENVQGSEFTMPIKDAGTAQKISVIANGATTRFPLSNTSFDTMLSTPVPATATTTP
jgi:hypothetical protein